MPETLRFHVEGMLEDNENIPDWLANGVYEFDYKLDTAALLQNMLPSLPSLALQV